MCQEGRFIRTEVEDQGIGIPADKLRHVFERFYQVDGSTACALAAPGLGLSSSSRSLRPTAGR